MMEASEFIALEVNGQEFGLDELLRPAQLTGRLQLITDAIDAALIHQAATSQAIAVSSEELQQAADDFRASKDLYDAQLTESWLAARGLTFEEWESLIESNLVKQKLREAITSGKVEQHFAENKLTFDSATISRLVLVDEDVARELRAQITEEGADFHSLARTYSIDDATRPAGGYAGELQRANMDAALEAAVFGAQPGKVVGPFKLDDGWHLIKIESLPAAKLDDALRETIKTKIFAQWLAEQRRNAKIKIPLLEMNALAVAEAEQEDTSFCATSE
jgi:putative peptide maturation system protein